MAKTIHGAMAILWAGGKRIAKVTNVDVDPEMGLVRSDPIGQYHSEELIYTGATVSVNFDIERSVANSLTAQGLWPKQSSDFDIANFAPLTVEVHDKHNGEVLERVSGFMPTRRPVNFRKGDLSMYRVSGEAIKATDDAEN